MKINPQQVIHVDPDFIKENQDKPKRRTGEILTEGTFPENKRGRTLRILKVIIFIALCIIGYLFMFRDYFGF